MQASFGLQLVQAALTVLIGVVVYVAGKFIEETFLKPINEQARLIVDVMSALSMYANLFTNPMPNSAYAELPPQAKDMFIEGQRVLRRLASELSARNMTIPWYRVWTFLRLAPPREGVQQAHTRLIGLSNSMPPHGETGFDAALKWQAEIPRLLGVERTPKQRRSKAQR